MGNDLQRYNFPSSFLGSIYCPMRAFSKQKSNLYRISLSFRLMSEG